MDKLVISQAEDNLEGVQEAKDYLFDGNGAAFSLSLRKLAVHCVVKKMVLESSLNVDGPFNDSGIKVLVRLHDHQIVMVF